jgi:hypothetical protein
MQSVARLEKIEKHPKLNGYVQKVTISGGLSEGQMRDQSNRCTKVS